MAMEPVVCRCSAHMLVADEHGGTTAVHSLLEFYTTTCTDGTKSRPRARRQPAPTHCRRCGMPVQYIIVALPEPARQAAESLESGGN